ncbi:MAG: GNAT family N-acetyltransferase [Oscillospiraceae bacterium]|nr:GNAT family N-acetyltransferase [Oscillospiraceae bacterium]
MNISIRPAVPSDCDSIVEIIKDSMGYINSPELIKENIKRLTDGTRDKIIIAEDGSNAVGFIHAENYDSLYSLPLKELISFAVRPDYQKKGIGSLLLSEIEKWAKDTGRYGIQIMSSADKKIAHSFYVNKGYELDKTQLNFKKYF